MAPISHANTETMTDEMIVKALDEVRARVKRIEHERTELDQAFRVASGEEQLLRRLLELRRGNFQASETPRLYQEGVGSDSDRDERANPAVTAVVEELASAGRPVHISELMRLLRARRIQIPGAGTQANLITHLRRDVRLVRPSRGMYGLGAWGLENMPAGLRKAKKKRIRVKAAKEI